MLLLIAVQKDNCIVHRQRKLQHDGHGIRHKRDRAKEEIRAHINDRSRQERDQKHRNLRIGLRRQKQHRHDDNSYQYRDRIHLLPDQLRLRIPQAGGQIIVTAVQTRLHSVKRLQTGFLLLVVIKRYRIISGTVGIMLLRIIELHRKDPRQLLQPSADLLRLPVRNIRHHHAAGSVCNKLLLHQIQPLPGLRGPRQIMRHRVLHPDPVSGYDRKNNQEPEEQEKEISLIHYKPAYFQHRLIIAFVRIQFFVHMQAPPSLIVNDITNFCPRLLQELYTKAPARPKRKFPMSLSIKRNYNTANVGYQ